MKKFVVGVMMAAVLSLSAAQGFAAEKTDLVDCDLYAKEWGYVDENGDGICDHADSVCGYTDENDDGICDQYQEIREDRGSNDGRRYRRMCGRGRSGGAEAECQRSCGRRMRPVQ